MNFQKNLMFYGISIALFLTLKWGYRYAETSHVLFLIKPVNSIVSIAANSDYTYNSDNGFYHPSLQMRINQSCSGFRFWILSALMAQFLIISSGYARNLMYILYPLTFLGTYFYTLIVNTSRILTSLLTPDLFSLQVDWFHQAGGIFVYMGSLIALYFLINFIVNSIPPKSCLK